MNNTVISSNKATRGLAGTAGEQRHMLYPSEEVRMKQTTMDSLSKKAVPTKPERVYSIDWLRVLAVLLLIPFHSARIFDTLEDFYVKSSQASVGLTVGIIDFLNRWQMPLFFLLAGAATWYALGFRETGEYVKERIKRLLIPLLFGVLVIVPLQAYVAALSHVTFAGSFLQYLPYYFTPHEASTDYTGLIFTVAHLWFILFLFPIMLVALPLLQFLKRDSGKRVIATLAGFCDKRGAFLLLSLPLFVAGFLPGLGGKPILSYLLLFVYGFLLMADERFREALAREQNLALVLGIGTFALRESILGLGFVPSRDPMGSALLLLNSSLCTWSWLVALLGLGQRYLNKNHRLLSYVNEAAYPFYILHQTVVVLIGYVVVQWALPVLSGYAIIVVSAFVATLLIYDVIVRRNNVTRFLFGMRLIRSAPGTVRSTAVGRAV
jgi:glucan biosynthesis protein C